MSGAAEAAVGRRLDPDYCILYTVSVLTDSTPRPNISTELADRLREDIVAGTLEPGMRLNEVHLAARLHVSRTPLREALSLLASEGFLTQAPRRGYFVPALSLADMRRLYGVRLILDPAALAEAGLPPAQQLARLDALNRRIAASRTPARTIDLDDAWHLALLAHLDNPLLLDLIRRFMRRTRPYEYAYLRERGHVAVATGTHDRIVRDLGRGRLDAAVRALRSNMEEGIPALEDWLTAREREPGGAR